MSGEKNMAVARDPVGPCPTLPEVELMINERQGNVIPVELVVPADGVTPLVAYCRLSENEPYSFLFESVVGASQRARYTYFGANPTGVHCYHEMSGEKDALQWVENSLDGISSIITSERTDYFTGGIVGFMGFDCVRSFAPKLGAIPLRADIGLPDAVYLKIDTLVVFDYAFDVFRIVSNLFVTKEAACDRLALSERYDAVVDILRGVEAKLFDASLASNKLTPEYLLEEGDTGVATLQQAENYKRMVAELKRYIEQGDIIQVVPSRRISCRTHLHPFDYYRELRAVNPSPYMFYMDLAKFQLLGASPELLVKVLNGTVTTHPIAGTRRRGAQESEDKALEKDLLLDEKERAEHFMLVDLGRNDINRVCQPNSVKTPSLLRVERYSHVMHLVSEVTGTLDTSCSMFDAFRSVFPAGTVSGAPKVRALELIYEQEMVKREFYAGAVGYFSYNGNMDTCIAIRTSCFKDGTAYFQAGGGIVDQSDIEAELEETTNKLMGNLLSLRRAEKRSFSSLRPKEIFTNSVEEPSRSPDEVPSVSLGLRSIEKLFSSRDDQVDEQLKLKVLMIDNYDSFTFNVVQYLRALGAQVLVYANDKITLQECIALEPTHVVVSPGPGKPCESRVALEVIRYFSGRIPVFGICLGEQAIFEVFGGRVGTIGSRIHGRTSQVLHDGLGVYSGINRECIKVARYHSLCAKKDTLPACLKVASETADQGLIMGVRHKSFTVEGVQFHPESILSEYGLLMLANFLSWTGGLWESLSKNLSVVDAAKRATAYIYGKSGAISFNLDLVGDETDYPNPEAYALWTIRRDEGSILKAIARQRLTDVQTVACQPGQTIKDLIQQAGCKLASNYRVRNLHNALKSFQGVAIFAEIKRASPSERWIRADASAVSYAEIFSAAGAFAISVLCEPHWFAGSIADLRSVRDVIKSLPRESAPLILCKDFIVHRYQILEAFVSGADTFLLIASLLTEQQLTQFIKIGRALGMEPLVEVTNAEECDMAVRCSGRVIGINNRDLNTFQVSPNKAASLSRHVKGLADDVLVVSLSGVKSAEDLPRSSSDIDGVLIGTCLMKSDNPSRLLERFVSKYCSKLEAKCEPAALVPPLVKICGITALEDLEICFRRNVSMVGLNFILSSKRYLTMNKARELTRRLPEVGRRTNYSTMAKPVSACVPLEERLRLWYSQGAKALETLVIDRLTNLNRSALVGVFSDTLLPKIVEAVEECKLDVVQIHQDVREVQFWTMDAMKVPCIYVIHIDASTPISSGTCLELMSEGVGHAALVLFDTRSKNSLGGTGTPFDWSILEEISRKHKIPFGIAGGLDTSNVQRAIEVAHPFLIDAASGLELSDGSLRKDQEALDIFLNITRQKSLMT